MAHAFTHSRATRVELDMDFEAFGLRIAVAITKLAPSDKLFASKEWLGTGA